MALLEVENVRRSFGGVVAVDGVTFRVTAGQIKAVIGPNGAGKTTLFNIVSGLLRPDAGRIVFKGSPIVGLPASWWALWQRALPPWLKAGAGRSLPPHRIARAGLARTYQNPSLFLQMNVLENVMVGRHRRSRGEFAACAFGLFGQRREERRIGEAAVAQLEYVGLAHLAHAPAGSLAFGERRMVELARALATEPELLLLDEPASGLNTREKADLGRFLRRLRDDRGITILLVEHDMTMVMDVSDEILVLHNGAPIAEGPPAVVQNDLKVIRVYLGGDLQHALAGQKS
jgi:branched-chain amino acid transport system ATP-binding protein